MPTKEDYELDGVEAKLRSLKEDFERNEELMRKAAIHYEDLVAKKEDLAASIAELKRARAESRPHAGR